MPKILKKQEVLCFEGLTISNFLDKNFLDKIKKSGIDMDAINLIFMAKEKGQEGNIYPIVLGHQSNEELKRKIININAPSGEASNKFIKLLEELE